MPQRHRQTAPAAYRQGHGGRVQCMYVCLVRGMTRPPSPAGWHALVVPTVPYLVGSMSSESAMVFSPPVLVVCTHSLTESLSRHSPCSAASIA